VGVFKKGSGSEYEKQSDHPFGGYRIEETTKKVWVFFKVHLATFLKSFLRHTRWFILNFFVGYSGRESNPSRQDGNLKSNQLDHLLPM